MPRFWLGVTIGVLATVVVGFVVAAWFSQYAVPHGEAPTSYRGDGGRRRC